jgi:hypothetical protein
LKGVDGNILKNEYIMFGQKLDAMKKAQKIPTLLHSADKGPTSQDFCTDIEEEEGNTDASEASDVSNF